MLTSLVANALKHGLHDKQDGVVALEASANDGMLCVSVHDNGVGLSSVGATGVGLTNIRQRLEAMYGAAARLEVGTVHDGGFFAQIAVPFGARRRRHRSQLHRRRRRPSRQSTCAGSRPRSATWCA